MNERYVGFVCGLGVGLAAGLLFAPLSGDGLRSSLLRNGRKRLKSLEKQTEGIREEIGNTIQRGKEAVTGTLQGAADAVRAL